jgi:hypothetical protein
MERKKASTPSWNAGRQKFFSTPIIVTPSSHVSCRHHAGRTFVILPRYLTHW